MTYPNEYHQVDFTAKELLKIPQDLLAFFVTSCLATDEINLFQKLYIMARNTAEKIDLLTDDISQKIASEHLMLMERNLASKLFEYVNMYKDFEKRYQRNKLPKFVGDFFAYTQNDINNITSAPGYKIVDWYRNSVAHHYSMHEAKKLFSEPALINSPHTFSLYLHASNGGSYYILGEQLMITKLAQDGANWVRGMSDFRQWMKDASSAVIEIHQEFCSRLIDSYFNGKAGQTVEISIPDEFVIKLFETKFPVGWNMKISKK